MRILPSLALLIALASLAMAQPTINVSPTKLDCPGLVLDVAFSRDGRLLAAGFGARDQSGVRIWSAADLKLITTIRAGNETGSGIKKIEFSPDGKLLAGTNWNGDVLLWTIGSTNAPRKLLTNRGSPETLSFSRDGAKLAFTSEESVVVYDLNLDQETTLATATGYKDSLVGASFSPKTDSLFIFRRSSVEHWNTNDKKLLRKWKTFDYNFFGDVSPDGNYLITGGGAVYGPKAVEIWDAKSAIMLGRVDGFRGGLFGLAIANREKLFVVTGGNYGQEGALSLWSFRNEASPYLPAVGPELSNLSPWTAKSPRELGFTSFGHDPIDQLTFSPDDKQLAVATGESFVLFYSVDQIRGPQIDKGEYALCGEIIQEDKKIFMAPLSKVPNAYNDDFTYAWKFEIANSAPVASLRNAPVILTDWNYETDSTQSKIRVNQFQPVAQSSGARDHIVFGEIQNPGWNEGLVTKIYQDGTFLVTTNPGKCLAYGKLDQFNTDFESVHKRLLNHGLLAVDKEPLGALFDHFRVRFVGFGVKNVRVTRSDSEAFGSYSSSRKRQAFDRIYDQEESFINALRNAGLGQVQN